jgi:type II secretory pathway pseudopilin PulG
MAGKYFAKEQSNLARRFSAVFFQLIVPGYPENIALKMESQLLTLVTMHKKYSTAGFTLIELVVAMGLATTALTLAGSGMMIISQRNQVVVADRTNRYELQRTINFMANEVKMAQQIHPCPQVEKDLYQPASGSKNHYPVLALQMPSKIGLTQPILYYVAEPPKNTVWSGPLVIYRWGPSMNLDGSYSNSSYVNEVVVDRLDPNSNYFPCQNPFSQSTANKPQGFTACIEPNGNAVKLSLNRRGDGSKMITWESVISRRSKNFTTETPIACPAV